MQPFPEAAVSVQMHTTDSERLSSTLEDQNFQASWQPSMLFTTDRVKALMYKPDPLVVCLNEYKVSKENLERKLSEEKLIMKAILESVKKLERKESSLQEEINLLQMTN